MHYIILLTLIIYATGVLLGLTLRVGAPIYFPLPPAFYAILTNTHYGTSGIENNWSVDTITHTAALAIRNGIISTFPEVRLVLKFITIAVLRWVY